MKYLLILLLIVERELAIKLLDSHIDDSFRAINIFENYDFIIHFDNDTFQSINNLIGVKNPKLLCNLDENCNMNRTSATKVVNLVYLANPRRFEYFTKEASNVKFEDVVIFFIENYGLIMKYEVWEMSGIDRVGGLFIVDMEMFDYFYVRFLCGSESKKLKKILIRNDVALNLMDYVNNFTNFNGHTFHIGYVPYRPFLWCR